MAKIRPSPKAKASSKPNSNSQPNNTIQQLVLIYVIFIHAVLVLCLVWRMRRLFDSRSVVLWMRRKFLYTTAWPRLAGSGNITAVGSILITAILALNTFCLLFRVRGLPDAASRAGQLALANMTILVLGSGGNVMVNYFLKMSVSLLSVSHRWLGRMCLLHAMVHCVCHMILTKAQLNPVQILLASVTVVILTLSFLFVRRRVYELFKGTHSYLSLVLVGTLWYHILQKKGRDPLCLVILVILSSLWLGSIILWVGVTHSFNNMSFNGTPIFNIKHFSEPGSLRFCKLKISLDSKRKISPGQHINLIYRNYVWYQSHPYIVAWDVMKGDKRSLYFLIEGRNGFSSSVQQLRSQKSVGRGTSTFCNRLLLDGPYGQNVEMRTFDKVLFLSQGIGIASQLLLIRQLVQTHLEQTARIRRLSLIWIIECKAQYDMAKKFLKALLQIDEREILNIYVVMTSAVDDNFKEDIPHLCFIQGPPNISEYLQKEWSAEAGNMALHICGNSQFEHEARRVVQRNSDDISLFTSDFRP